MLKWVILDEAGIEWEYKNYFNTIDTILTMVKELEKENPHKIFTIEEVRLIYTTKKEFKNE